MSSGAFAEKVTSLIPVYSFHPVEVRDEEQTTNAMENLQLWNKHSIQNWKQTAQTEGTSSLVPEHWKKTLRTLRENQHSVTRRHAQNTIKKHTGLIE